MGTVTALLYFLSGLLLGGSLMYFHQYMVIKNKIELLTQVIDSLQHQMKISVEHMEGKLEALEQVRQQDFKHFEHLYDESIKELLKHYKPGNK